MATEYVVDGPVVKDITAVDTVPKYAVGTKVITATVGLDKPRIYRYTKASAAVTAGAATYISSVGALLYGARAGGMPGALIGVPQINVTSPTGSSYQWTQTGGYFDNTGAAAGVGITCVSAVAGTELYLSATAGSFSSGQGVFPITPVGARALSNATTAAAYAYSADELVEKRDLLA